MGAGVLQGTRARARIPRSATSGGVLVEQGMLRPLALSTLALTACATTTTLEAAGSVGGAPQPVVAMAQHEERELNAEQRLQSALTDCDRAMASEHLLPSEFMPAEASYKDKVKQAVLQDATLRSSPTVWHAPSGKADSYDAWLTRCDAWFGANHDLFASAGKVEDAARQGKPPAGTGRLFSCQVEGGKLTTCGDAFSGEAPVLREGHYLRCEVVGGQVNHCGEPFDGQAPLKQGDAWHDCDLAAGQIAACSDLGYDGVAPSTSPAP